MHFENDNVMLHDCEICVWAGKAFFNYYDDVKKKKPFVAKGVAKRGLFHSIETSEEHIFVKVKNFKNQSQLFASYFSTIEWQLIWRTDYSKTKM